MASVIGHVRGLAHMDAVDLAAKMIGQPDRLGRDTTREINGEFVAVAVQDVVRFVNQSHQVDRVEADPDPLDLVADYGSVLGGDLVNEDEETRHVPTRMRCTQAVDEARVRVMRWRWAVIDWARRFI